MPPPALVPCFVMAEDTSIENRVYLFKDLASAWIAANPGLLGAADPGGRARALSALADLAFVSCVVADGEDLEAGEVAAKVRAGA